MSVLVRVSNLLDIPPDWEARRDGTGRQVYYDHERKVVRLDKPDQETGQSSRALHSYIVGTYTAVA